MLWLGIALSVVVVLPRELGERKKLIHTAMESLKPCSEVTIDMPESLTGLIERLGKSGSEVWMNERRRWSRNRLRLSAINAR